MTLQLEMSPEGCGSLCFVTGIFIGFILGMAVKWIGL